MALWNNGSVALEVSKLVSNIPTAISGTVLLNICDRQRIFVQNYLGVSIGSNAIDEKYQDGIVKLSVSDVLMFSNPNGMDKDIRIGELAISKTSNTESLTIPS